LTHQAGCVTDPRHVAPTGGNLETVQIGPNENNSGGNRGGKNSNLYGDAAMEADAGGFNRAMHRGFKSQDLVSIGISFQSLQITAT
jgi:hypothetical protein